LANAERNAGEENRPSSNQLSNATGTAVTGIMPSSESRLPKIGCGLRTNVQHNTSPLSLGKPEAANETAIGPENDSLTVAAWKSGR
jgi:hypothetical protein